jgi:hypothetical protein
VSSVSQMQIVKLAFIEKLFLTNCVLSLGSRHSVPPRNLRGKHSKKCVFGVFLNRTRIALECVN